MKKSQPTPKLDVDAIYKALANPVRREILACLREPKAHFADQELLLEHGVCAGRIDAHCELSQSTVSAHLAALQKAGLVTSKRVGQWVFFKRNEPVIEAFLAHMNKQL
ncbi:ArsR/SmtB family transcription factor [Paraburkholderia tagetis]|uniref:Helix-turn-helix domain-containing protein n=1 Tax=Paraburkholderia tagetis TaxID=2913261 RepID=A0A9X1UKW0_9BURK|nr:metalloregulator ArsR/SmtB family transcription factor [Paraburkholderia tagetis]MCG5076181.1 helix-turn-helix domain-containing protein [Paraburkholderia tagetis]